MVDRLVNSEANAKRIAAVENCFGAFGQPLSIQGRVLVGEGVLTKMCRKKAKPRQFFLFNDILVYGNIVLKDKKKYYKQHIIPLEEVKLENLEDDGVMKNGWLIRTPTKSFAVYAATATEKTEWMAHINKCVDDLLKKTGKKPSMEHAAVWIPDAEASICMHCRKTQFTVLNRRHHCRKCGAVVCNSCSNKKFLLPAQSSKPLRVCQKCYDTLSRTRVNTGEVEQLDKQVNQDTSGEDDSEDDMDDERVAGDDDATEFRDLADEKPTFYSDTSDIIQEENRTNLTATDVTSSTGFTATNVASSTDCTTTDIASSTTWRASESVSATDYSTTSGKASESVSATDYSTTSDSGTCDYSSTTTD